MTARDEEREKRIEMRIVVDAYTVEEQAYGWHAYLDDTMDFPFEARCTTEREASPLKEPVGASDDTEQAIADWHYWLER